MILRLLSAVCTAICIYSNAAMAVSFTPLGDLPGVSFYSEAYGVSADGSVVVGRSESASAYEAFRWTSEDGMVGLGHLPGGYFDSRAYGVSADGSVVVGQGYSASGEEAFRWTSEDGMVGLGDLPGGEFSSTASGVSADGSVVVGRGDSVLGWRGYEAFRWTSEDGMVGLGDLPGGYFGSGAYGVSADGSVVVGESISAHGVWMYEYWDIYEAFRWTSEDGMVGLGDLSDGGGFYNNGSGAYGVSADGSVVVGRSETASGYEAFLWTSEDGMQNVAWILATSGVDLTGWTLESATGVSADGYTIVGVGTNPDGRIEAWMADLSGVAPTTKPVDLSGTIKTPDGTDICAMVLVSGQYMYSCNPAGVFSLEDLPRESNGAVKCQMYADGFLPEINYLAESTSEAFVMTRSGTCPNYNLPYNPAFVPGSAGKEIYIAGQVLLENTQTPICAIVLANGQYMFSCDGTGNYFLEIPLDNNGQFKLQVYADGFAPSIRTFDEFKTTNIVRMTPAVDCQ